MFDMDNITIAGRRSGKTVRIIFWALATNSTVVTTNKNSAEHIRKVSMDMGCPVEVYVYKKEEE